MTDLHSQVWHCLDLNLLDGALFASEQLYVLHPSDESRFLYGLVLYRQRRFKSAFKALEGEGSLASAYIYALCALEISKYSAGIDALIAMKPWVPNNNQRGSPSVAAVQLVLGKLYKAEKDRHNAALHLAQSAKAEPFLAENVTALLQVPGFKIELDTLFDQSTDDSNTSDFALPTSVRSPISIPRTPLLVDRRRSGTNPLVSSSGGVSTPAQTRDFSGSAYASSTPIRISSGSLDTPLSTVTTRGHRDITPTHLKTPDHPPLPAAPLRRKIARHVEGDDLFLSPSTLFDHSKPKPVLERPEGTNGEVTVTGIYKIYYEALKAATKFENRRCLAELEKLPKAHQETPSILAIVGRCHFELRNYKRSHEIYNSLHILDPYRTEDMEYFSTVLWQLKMEPQLAFLAHEMVSIDRDAWQTWCVLGNSFSLQYDSTSSLDCFKRATSLNPNSAVAYSLQGHEFLLNEEFETAIDSFRSAIRADSLAYNAWFGLAMVNFRSERLDAAESNVSQALQINPNNAAMLCFAGIINDEMGKTDKATQFYQRAREIDPENSTARYQIARLLTKQGKYTEALKEMTYLSENAPEDADIHLGLGNLYRLQNDSALAIKHYTNAVALDPRLHTRVKHEMGRPDDVDSEEIDF